MDFNTKVTINGRKIYLVEAKDKSIGQELFFNLLDFSNEFIMNDDGSKFSKKLSKFDISPNKETGNIWQFKIDSESKKIMPKVFDYYLNKEWGHWFWALKGKDFTIEYRECGDESYYEEFMLENEQGKKTIYNDFKIKSKGNSLKIVKDVINNFSSSL